RRGRGGAGGGGAGDRGVAGDGVGAGGRPARGGAERGERSDPFDGRGDLPALVRVDRDREVRPADLARLAEPADVVLEIGADLELDLGEAVGHGLTGEALELLIGVAEPPGARGVRRISGREQFGLALLAPGRGG